MRPPVDAERIREFAHRLGRVAPGRTRIYLTGGDIVDDACNFAWMEFLPPPAGPRPQWAFVV
jgi:hypothetical protein